jgi:hypothetical protein
VIQEFADALRLSKGLPPTPSNIERVGREVGAEAARWAFNQWELRKRAAAKFVKAGEMLFDREALEMATHERVAAYHASKFPQGVLVVDLTSGIGGDLIALARRGPAKGFELDLSRAEYARHNVCVYCFNAEVNPEDSLDATWEWQYAVADPARRGGGRRSLNPEDFTPNPRRVADRFRDLELGLIKLSPMLDDKFLESFGGELEFISHRGECAEALVWLGRQASQGRKAVHIETGETLEASEAPFPTDEPVAFLYEADPSAIRAHCLGALCAPHGLLPLADTNGYLTGTADVSGPWLKGYAVLWHGAYREKVVKQAIREHGLGLTAVKTRGVSIDPAQQLKRLRTDGKPAVLLLFKSGENVRAVLAAPI